MNSFWLIIIIFSLSIGLVCGGIGFLISHWFFRRKNNPYLARIYVTGIDRPYEGQYAYSSKEGSVYRFNKGNIVVVPENYGFDYHYYKRTIYLDNLHHLIAIPKGDGKPLNSSAREELLKELWQSHIGAEAVRAIKRKDIMSPIIIIIVVVIAIASGVVGYAVHRPPKAIQPIAPITQPVAPPIEPGILPEP